LLAQLESRGAPVNSSVELQETASEKAERLTGEALAKLGWKETDLAERRKGDPTKFKIALTLRAETTMTLKWIATRLQMGTASSLSNLFSARQTTKR
jgi:hypothetical protein